MQAELRQILTTSHDALDSIQPTTDAFCISLRALIGRLVRRARTPSTSMYVRRNGSRLRWNGIRLSAAGSCLSLVTSTPRRSKSMFARESLKPLAPIGRVSLLN